MQPHQKSNKELDFEWAFLSEEEHRTIRTLTQILSWAQPLVEEDGLCTNDVDQVCLERTGAEPKSQRNLLNSFLQSNDGGGSEAIALLPGCFRAGGLALFAGGSQGLLGKSASVDDQQEGNGDPRPANTPQNGSKDLSFPRGERCRVGFTHYEVPPSFVHNALPSFLDLLENRGNQVPPALTLQLTLLLLKHCHVQIGKEARQKSFEDFNLFMTCIGLNRLWERFDFGASSRNFYDIMCLLDEDEPTAGSLNDAVSKMKSPNANEENSSGVAHLTKHKKALFKELLWRLQLISKDEHQESGKIDYNAPRFFYRVLSSLLKKLKVRLNCAKLYQPPKGRQSTFDRAAFGNAIRALVDIVQALWLFVDHFRQVGSP
ncbi:uncharacterized protein Z520_03363 [Fonsecaea multimorphosa CBS 102226]|uniref:Uncharacterized protein n=1 Tax=Fonsecaea multimorphosa CBS 102226 TaxID=1442371 RepID=A0A0D2K4E8_9EURO|nr:uncharacterized protein Z520_03363 [Fonsecaea multimorphosa CBS 102226]KIY00698.1 hypothetical protein Z520_03363 [Fonsecaea multimorphosa CBS 102226]